MKDEGGRMKDLKSRTKEFALRVIRLFAALPKTTEAQVIGKQLLRSGTSVGATQRLKEYIIKGFTLDDERLKNPDQPFDYFEELTRRIQDIPESKLNELLKEADELTAILVTCVKNAKEKR